MVKDSPSSLAIGAISSIRQEQLAAVSVSASTAACGTPDRLAELPRARLRKFKIPRGGAVSGGGAALDLGLRAESRTGRWPRRHAGRARSGAIGRAKIGGPLGGPGVDQLALGLRFDQFAAQAVCDGVASAGGLALGGLRTRGLLGISAVGLDAGRVGAASGLRVGVGRGSGPLVRGWGGA